MNVTKLEQSLSRLGDRSTAAVTSCFQGRSNMRDRFFGRAVIRTIILHKILVSQQLQEIQLASVFRFWFCTSRKPFCV